MSILFIVSRVSAHAHVSLDAPPVPQAKWMQRPFYYSDGRIEPTDAWCVELESLEQLADLSKQVAEELIVSFKDRPFGPSISIYDDYAE